MAPAGSVFVFPGQGSQRPGMLTLAPENDTLDRLLDAAEGISGLPIRELGEDESLDPEALLDTRVSQPLLYLVDWAWAVALMDTGIEPVALAGHSLGEFVALAVSGAISVEAGLELVIQRSKLMAKAAEVHPGSMTAVLGLSQSEVREFTDRVDGVWVANDNSTKQTVLSGRLEALAEVSELLAAETSARLIPLKVSGGFHSPLMEPAAERFAESLRQAEFRSAVIPVLSNAEPTPTQDPEILRQRLISQMTAPVRWTETMAAISELAPVVAIESGPGSVLRGLARGVPGVSMISVESVGLEHIVEEVMSR